MDESVKEKVASQGTEIQELKRRMKALEDVITSLTVDIRDIRDNLLRRPSWLILAVITSLCSIVTGLILKLVS